MSVIEFLEYYSDHIKVREATKQGYAIARVGDSMIVIDLNELPRHDNGRNKGRIDWTKTINNNVRINYNDVFYILKITSYKNNYLTIKFDEKEFKIFTGHFKKGRIGRIVGAITDEYRYKIGDVFQDNERDMVVTDREYREDSNNRNWKYYKYTCNKCGWTEGWIREGELKNNKGCSCCCNPPRVIVPHINSIKAKAPWMCDLGVSEEDSLTHSPCSHDIIQVVCPECDKNKRIIISNIYRNKSIGCNCGDKFSYISKYIFLCLVQLKLEFNTEVKYEWNKYINPLTNKESQASIDFVIYHNGREIPLEADGGWHRKDNNLSGQTKEQSEYIDKQRDDNCLKYLGEETIRISDEGDVKESILNSKLVKEFDITQIDWLKCEEFAIKSNLVREVCDYWNNKEEWETTTDLARLFNLNATTIRGYLKKGNKIGWCYYTSNNDNYNGRFKKGEGYIGNRKQVGVYKDNILIEVFNSCSELERQSEKVFGVKLNNSKISQVCNGKKPQYKGFVFKYIDLWV